MRVCETNHALDVCMFGASHALYVCVFGASHALFVCMGNVCM